MLLHGNCVAWQGRGCLILGPSGAGKSRLSLALMAHGATLVADDRVMLAREGEQIIARAPEVLRGQIEARGVGILAADFVDKAPLALVVDLAQPEPERVPPLRQWSAFDLALPLVFGSNDAQFYAVILQLLKGRRLHEV